MPKLRHSSMLEKIAGSGAKISSMVERLQKILSQWGVASRRQAESLLVAGQVRLNGKVAQLGDKADPNQDEIEVNGVLLRPTNRPEAQYILLHKPAGVVSTCKDPWGRPTVLEVLSPALQPTLGLHPVGRLDADSTGALILSNDGDFTFSLTHPCHSIPKTYRVWVQGIPSDTMILQWRRGIQLDGRTTRPAQVTVLDHRHSPEDQTLLEIVLREGRNRQIRRIAAQLGHPVVELHRIAIGIVTLGHLPCGHHRPLSNAEVASLRWESQVDAEHHPVEHRVLKGRG
jgi:23S rRNA pseudouridine2605 synthase